jgi:hypothetical protein
MHGLWTERLIILQPMGETLLIMIKWLGCDPKVKCSPERIKGVQHGQKKNGRVSKSTIFISMI